LLSIISGSSIVDKAGDITGGTAPGGNSAVRNAAGLELP